MLKKIKPMKYKHYQKYIDKAYKICPDLDELFDVLYKSYKKEIPKSVDELFTFILAANQLLEANKLIKINK